MRRMTQRPRSFSECERAILRATLGFPGGTALPAIMNENVRDLLGVDETYMSCPRCGGAVQGGLDSDRRCQEFRCDECRYAFAKST